MKPIAVIATHPIQYQTPLYRYLAKRGIPLHVIFLCKRGYRGGHDVGFDQEVTWDIPMLDGFSHQFASGWGSTPERFFGILSADPLTSISARKFSVVLVHGWRSLSMLMAVARANIGGMPVLYRAETTSLSSSITGAARRVLASAVRRSVAACLSIGTLNDQFYASIGVPTTRRFLMPYAVDNARFQAAAASISSSETRRTFGISEDAPVVLFAGKLVPWKRPDLLLRAFAAAAPPDARLVFAGTGPMLRDLQAEAAVKAPDRVIFAGFQNQTQIPLAYRAADLLVLPSDHEPWGLVVNEAMNFAIPAVVSRNVGCGPDLIQSGATGETFRAGDKEHLETVLQRLLEDRDPLQVMGCAARARIDRWGFAECEAGLLEALASVGVRP